MSACAKDSYLRQGIREIFFRVMQADDFLFDGPLGNQVVDRYRTGLADPVGPV